MQNVTTKQLSMDQIMAIDLLLTQIEKLNDYNYENIRVVESERGREKNQYVLQSLSGMEDEGVIMFLDNEQRLCQSMKNFLLRRFMLNDIREICYKWQSKNLFEIGIALEQQAIQLLFSVPQEVIIIK